MIKKGQWKKIDTITVVSAKEIEDGWLFFIFGVFRGEYEASGESWHKHDGHC